MSRHPEHHDEPQERSILGRTVVLLLAMSCGLLIGSILAPAKARFTFDFLWPDDPLTHHYWIMPI